MSRSTYIDAEFHGEFISDVFIQFWERVGDQKSVDFGAENPPYVENPPLLRERRMFDILGFGKIMDSPPQAKFFWGKNELIEGKSLP